MTERFSNAEFLMVEPRLPTEASGWEVRVISPHDWTTVIGYVRNWRELAGSKEVNGFGAGSIVLNTNNPILSTPFPAGLTGNLRKGEFLWQFWRDGILRHEWISDDEKENEVYGTSTEQIITFSGRTLEKVLEWGIHYPVWGERQAWDLRGNPTGGYYRLNLRGHITPQIMWNATPDDVKAALESLPDINPGDITVRMSTESASRYIVQFLGRYTGVDVPRLQVESENLTAATGDPEVDIPDPDDNNSWTDLTSTITGQPAIASVIAFLERVQSRGVLPFLDMTFTATHDSAGLPWSDITDISLSPGETLLELLQRLSDMLQWEFKVISGFRLWIQQDTYGVNRANQVVFYKAGHQIAHERSSSSRDVVTDVFTQSSKFEIAHTSATSPVTPWKREAWVEAGGSPSISSASIVGNATIAVRKDKKVSRTLSVLPELKTRTVFIDYNVADTVKLETNDGMEDIKIVGVSFSSDPDNEFGLELVIQSAFEAREVRTQRALEKMGSKGATGGKGSSPTGPPPVSRLLGMRDLTDVKTGGVLEGDILVRQGTSWVRVQPGLDLLSDVDTDGIANGRALIYDSAAGQWKPGQPTVSMTINWTDIEGKPLTFPPSTHSHAATDITGSTAVGRSVLTAVDAAAARAAIGAGTGTSNLALGTTSTTAKAGNYQPAWTDITSKPSSFEPIAKPIDHHTDVDTSTTAPTAGQALVWDAVSSLWKPGNVAPPASTLDALTDVETAGQAEGKLLGYLGGVWKPVDAPEGGGGTVPVDTMRFRGTWAASLLVNEDITFDSGTWPLGTVQSGNPWSIATQADGVAGTTKAAVGTGITNAARQVTIPVNMPLAGSLWIRYWLQSENGYDWFDINVDGVNKLHSSGAFGSWQELEITGLSAGSHSLVFSFSNDGSATAGFNAAYVSRIRMKKVDASDPYLVGHVVSHEGDLWQLVSGDGLTAPAEGPMWRNLTAAGAAEEPAEGIFTVGDVEGTTTGNTWATAYTNLTVRKAFTLTRLGFYATGPYTYTLMKAGQSLGQVTATAAGTYYFEDLQVDMPVGTYLFGVDPASDVAVRFRNVASILYSGTDFDFTAEGWTAIDAVDPAGTYVVPYIYEGQAPIIPPVKFLGDLVDVDTAGVVSGQVLTFNGTDWVPEEPSDPFAGSGGWPEGPVDTLPAVLVGDTTGANSDPDRASYVETTLTVRTPGRLTRFEFFNLYVVPFTLNIDGVTVGASKEISSAVGAWDINVWLNAGTHTIRLWITDNRVLPWNMRSVASIDYIAGGVDMTASGWNGNGAKTPPWKYTFAPADPSEMLQSGPVLDALGDVNVPNPQDEDVLKWDAATARWIPGPQAQGPEGPEGPQGAPGHSPITVSATEPTTPQVGDIWFDLS